MYDYVDDILVLAVCVAFQTSHDYHIYMLKLLEIDSICY